jgi:hypothetical protein
MKTNKWRLDRGNLPFALLLVMLLLTVTSCDKGLLEDVTPSWLGASIYDNLKSSGDFENMVRLIDDLDYKATLSTTGSKTLFAAADSSFEKFYAGNTWGVRSYEDLSVAQKKLLLFNSLVNNAYSLNLLSSSAGPNLGDCMRRGTQTSIYDSVAVLMPSDMASTKYWNYYKTNNKSLVMMTDMTARPIIHFLEKQLVNNDITNNDVDVLMNFTTTRKAGDASINGVPVVMKGANTKCLNGFVHVLDGVLTPAQNMAEIIKNKPSTQIFSQLLERFSAPFYNATATENYNRLNGTTVDSVFQKRYFSSLSQGGKSLAVDAYGKAAIGLLKLDPGWNTYYLESSAGTTAARAMQQDMAAMFVPSDDAMKDYFENKGGKVLMEYFKPAGWPSSDYTWVDYIPSDVVTQFINVNMMTSFKSTVPSKFESILDDAAYNMNVTQSDVDSVFLGCNGAVYQTNKVFVPTAFASVSFPALINQNMSIAYWAIQQKNYDAYLNSKEATYSLFVPSNAALQHYIDPVSYGKTKKQLYKFWWNSNAVASDGTDKVRASVFEIDNETGELSTDSTIITSSSIILNRLFDVLETHTVIGDVTDGNTYYRTKGGSTLKVSNVGLAENGMTVAGSAQIDSSTAVSVAQIYTQGNGKTYMLKDEPIMTTSKSVIDVLDEHPDVFARFSEYLKVSGYLVETQNNGANSNAHSNNIGFLTKYHYTVYAPTNSAIEAMQTAGELPTIDQVSHVEGETTADSLIVENELQVVRDFVQYHIQDNAIFVNPIMKASELDGTYQTANFDSKNKRFNSLKVSVQNGALSVTDSHTASPNTRHVVTDGLYNLIAREYQYDSKDALSASSIYCTSEIVIHQIDGVLLYK